MKNIKMKLYHFTRLLNEEVNFIREQGIKIPSTELFIKKIAFAHEHVEIPSNITITIANNRDDLCFTTYSHQKYKIDDNLSAIEELFSNWGGEIITDSADIPSPVKNSINLKSTPYEIEIETELLGFQAYCIEPDGGDGENHRFNKDIPANAITSIKVINNDL